MPALFSSPITTITPHTLYHAGVWIRGLNATGENRLGLAWFDAAGGYLAQNESSLLPNGTTSWIRLSVGASAPAGAAYVQIHLTSAHDSGTVWFDDVTFGGRVR